MMDCFTLLDEFFVKTITCCSWSFPPKMVFVYCETAYSAADGCRARNSGFAEVELEQVDGIAPADLVAIVLADAGAVEPVGGMIDVFERPVDREQERSAPISRWNRSASACGNCLTGQEELALK